jgi:hypothetical protein
MKYTLVNCSPVPAPMAPIVSHLLRVSGASLQSAYRGTDASALLARCGKHDQAYLYNGWVRRLPGFNPANPPGRSTHELRSDGIAYRGPVGRRLRWWQIGLDIDDAHVAAFIAAAAKDGWLVFRPYPSGSEYHHVNFKKKPRIHLPALKRGQKAVRVRGLINLLHTCGYVKYPLGQSRFFFSEKIEDAVKKFQRAHHLKADGVVGSHTMVTLKAAARWHKRHS